MMEMEEVSGEQAGEDTGAMEEGLTQWQAIKQKWQGPFLVACQK